MEQGSERNAGNRLRAMLSRVLLRDLTIPLMIVHTACVYANPFLSCSQSQLIELLVLACNECVYEKRGKCFFDSATRLT